MSDEPRTPHENGVRMGTSTWLSKWLPHRKRQTETDEWETDERQSSTESEADE